MSSHQCMFSSIHMVIFGSLHFFSSKCQFPLGIVPPEAFPSSIFVYICSLLLLPVFWCLFLVLPASAIKCPSPTSKMVAMSVPSIRMHVAMSSIPIPLILICFLLPYVVILFFCYHIPNSSLLILTQFFFSSPVLLSPPSRHTCTCRRRSQTLFQLLEQRVVSDAKLNGREVENSLCTSCARFTTQTLKPQ